MIDKTLGYFSEKFEPEQEIKKSNSNISISNRKRLLNEKAMVECLEGPQISNSDRLKSLELKIHLSQNPYDNADVDRIYRQQKLTSVQARTRDVYDNWP